MKELFNFNDPPQEETGSAEEQPASNKADTYTVIRSLAQAGLLITGKLYGLKKLIWYLVFMRVFLFRKAPLLAIQPVTFVIIFGRSG